MTRRPSVIIAGAGIVGATLAYHLASAGASVTIIERSPPASGATARSFAWINVIHGNASDIARLRNLATAEYRRLERELHGALAIDWNGALTWSGNPVESERVVTEHTAWGYDVRLVEREEIRRLEPRLAAPPPVAAHAPGEGALDPVAATLTLVRAAVEAGARLVEGTEVQGLASTDGRVCGVVLPSGTIEADTVVLAAGTNSKAICAGIGIELPRRRPNRDGLRQGEAHRPVHRRDGARRRPRHRRPPCRGRNHLVAGRESFTNSRRQSPAPIRHVRSGTARTAPCRD